MIRFLREEMGLHPDPIEALHQSGYEAKIAAERGVSEGGGGYPQGD